MNNYQQNKNKSSEFESTFHYLAFISRLIKYWYLFPFTIASMLIIAYYYIKYNPSVYEVSTTLYIKDEAKNLKKYKIKEVTDLYGDIQNIGNEKIVLSSFSTIKETIKDLKWYVSYYEKNKYTKVELYNKTPINVNIDTNHIQSYGYEYSLLIISQKEFKLLNEDDTPIDDKVFKFGEIIETNEFKIKISSVDTILNNYIGKKVIFCLNNIDQLAIKYMGIIKADEIDPKNASVLSISIKGNNVQKSVDFLNTLTSVYINKKLSQKNQIAVNTINFINNLLLEISDSLLSAENKLKNFKSDNKFMDIINKSQIVFNQLSILINQKSELVIRDKYCKYLKESIEKNTNINDIIAPSSFGIDDLLLSNLIIDLSNLYTQKNTLTYSALKSDYLISSINNKINSTKKMLIDNIKNITNSTNIAINDINNRIEDANGQIDKLPDTEQKLARILRKYKLNDATYTYLLQQRAEAQIARASNIPDCYVIDRADSLLYNKVSTKSKIIYLTFLIVGLMIPTIFVFIKEFLYGKIIEKNDVEQITDIPIIASIYHSNKKDTDTVVFSYPKEPISEIYRKLCTNLNYYTKKDMNNVLLVTSSVLGEGKTFNAINIASVIALFGHKTVLIDFDLRRPKLYSKLKLDKNIGVSSYLINNATIDDIIITSEWKNLDVITSGPTPPNPAELIASENTKRMLSELKLRYDYIIMDTPPISLVTDANLLMEHSNLNLFIVRQGITPLKVLSNITKELENREQQNFCIIINDVKYMFQSYYGYDYTYAYYDDKKVKDSY